MKINKQILFQPIFLITLTILLLNDHVLKAAYPGWLTGKLSDFAGLFVMAILIYAVAGKSLRSSKALIGMHIILAASFIIWKIAPVELIFIEISKHINIPLPGRVKDATDLMALSVLPLSYLFIKRISISQPLRLSWKKLQSAASISILLITGIAVIATTPGKKYHIEPDTTVETYKKKHRLMEIFEQTMAENNIEIQQTSEHNDTTFKYKLNFSHSENPPVHDWPDQERKFISYITLILSPSNHTLKLESIDGWVTHDIPSDESLKEFYMNHVVEPFVKKLK